MSSPDNIVSVYPAAVRPSRSDGSPKLSCIMSGEGIEGAGDVAGGL